MVPSSHKKVGVIWACILLSGLLLQGQAVADITPGGGSAVTRMSTASAVSACGLVQTRVDNEHGPCLVSFTNLAALCDALR
jgi:hypothetical protein